MGQNVRQGWSEQSPLRQQRLDQADGLWRQVFRKCGILGQDLRPRHVVVVVIKRQLAAEQSVQDDAQAPHVHLFTGIFLALEHLRRGVTYCAAEGL